MQSVRRKFKKNNNNRFDKIVQAALNPDHVNDSLAAIRKVNAGIAGKMISLRSSKFFTSPIKLQSI